MVIVVYLLLLYFLYYIFVNTKILIFVPVSSLHYHCCHCHFCTILSSIMFVKSFDNHNGRTRSRKLCKDHGALQIRSDSAALTVVNVDPLCISWIDTTNAH